MYRPSISGGTGNYRISYSCYNDSSEQVAYFSSNDDQVAITVSAAGRYVVHVIVSDGNSSVNAHTNWLDVQ